MLASRLRMRRPPAALRSPALTAPPPLAACAGASAAHSAMEALAAAAGGSSGSGGGGAGRPVEVGRVRSSVVAALMLAGADPSVSLKPSVASLIGIWPHRCAQRAAAAAAPPDGIDAGGSAGGGGDVEETWETADVEAQIRSMKLYAAREETAPDSVRAATPGNGGDYQDQGSCSPVAELDDFLRAALQNPRDRLTILRMEHEVEKFMRDPRAEQLELAPQPSTSYYRLAAHRVAQHYALQTQAVDGGAGEGARVFATKTADSCFPKVRLMDYSVKEQGACTDVAPAAKLVTRSFSIKQRPQKACGESEASDREAFRVSPVRSVEERKEEYHRARARIFSNGSSARSSDDESGSEKGSATAMNVLGAPGGTLEGQSPPTDSVAALQVDRPAGTSTGAVPLEGAPQDGKAPEQARGSGRRGRGLARSEDASTTAKGRVAIFRNKEKDRRDPDYDRSYDRYSQRYDAAYIAGLAPHMAYGGQPLYTPQLVAYNADFPALGGGNVVSQSQQPTAGHVQYTSHQPLHMDAYHAHSVSGLRFDPAMVPQAYGSTHHYDQYGASLAGYVAAGYCVDNVGGADGNRLAVAGEYQPLYLGSSHPHSQLHYTGEAFYLPPEPFQGTLSAEPPYSQPHRR
eukprot:SM000501S17666  [mRNA]  locus=s501:151:3453:+ [translate_table: standard]